MQRIPLGLDPTNVLSFRIALAGQRYESAHERGRLIASSQTASPRCRRRRRGRDDVRADHRMLLTVRHDDRRTDNDPRHVLMVTGNMITPGFFRALRIPLLAGRDFTAADDSGAPKVAIISETFAKKFWPAGDAIGHRVDTGNGMGTIVGIVGDIKQARMIDPPEPQFYRPHLQDPWETMTFTVRVRTGDPKRIVPDVRRILKELDPTLPVYGVSTLEQAISDVVDSHRLFGLLFAAFALVALLLATAGIYATMSFFVARRTRELGLRVALGAEPMQCRGARRRTGRDAHCRRCGDRRRHRCLRRARTRAHVLRCHRERTGRLCDCDCRARRGGDRGDLSTGTPGECDRSDDCVTDRMTIAEHSSSELDTLATGRGESYGCSANRGEFHCS